MAITNYRELSFDVMADERKIELKSYIVYGTVETYTKRLHSSAKDNENEIINAVGGNFPTLNVYLKKSDDISESTAKTLQENVIQLLRSYPRLFNVIFVSGITDGTYTKEATYKGKKIASKYHLYFYNTTFIAGVYKANVYGISNSMASPLDYGYTHSTAIQALYPTFTPDWDLLDSSDLNNLLFSTDVTINLLLVSRYDEHSAKLPNIEELKLLRIKISSDYSSEIELLVPEIDEGFNRFLASEDIPPQPKLPDTPQPIPPDTPPEKSTIFTNTSDRLTVNKLLESVAEVDLIYKQPTDILNPTIQISGDEELIGNVLTKGNYIYIKDFNRYYYITGMQVLRTGLLELTCHVDVLMSHRSQYLKLPAVIARQSDEFNLNLPDRDVVLSAKPIIKTQQFDQGFNDYSIVVAVNGKQELQ